MLLWLLAPLPLRWSAGRRSNIEALWLTASDDGALTTELTTNHISFGSCLVIGSFWTHIIDKHMIKSYNTTTDYCLTLHCTATTIS